jgi:hypothetical protein
MKIELYQRIFLVGMFVFFISCSTILTTQVDATTEYDEDDYVVPAYSTRNFAVYLGEDEGMAGWFRINNGDGIHFFIVDEFGHDEVQSTGSATTAYNIENYARSEGRWYYWNFVAPDTDTWHIYFSNAISTTYAGIEDEIDIIIRSDTEAPQLESMTPLPRLLTGEVTIDFKVVDDCFPVEKVEVYIGNELLETKINPNLETGYVFEGSFTWSTYNWDNDNYTLYLRAYDTLGKMSAQLGVVEVEVVNGWLDYPSNRIILMFCILGFIGLIVIGYCVLKSR